MAASRPAAALAAVAEALADTVDLAARAQLLRAEALAHANLSDLHRAAEAITAASALAAAAADEHVRAEVEMTRAGILGWQGDTAGALEAIEVAIANLDGPARARAIVQRGTIRYRAGQLAAAVDDFAAAEPDLSEDMPWRGRLLTNWALVIAYRGDLPNAEAKLVEARRIYEAAGMDSAAAEVVQNLGWVAVRGGDLPKAFAYFDEAEAVYLALGYAMGESWRDRSEALLAAHLTNDAKTLALRAVDELRTSGLEAALPEALTRVARAALLDDDPQTALRAARAAEQQFARQERPAWRALGQYLVLQARFALDDLELADLDAIGGVAAALDAAGFLQAAQHAHILGGKIALAGGQTSLAQLHLLPAARARGAGPIDLRIQAWLAEALWRLAQDDRRGADAAARAGLGVLEQHRETIGATDARANISAHGAELAAIGTRLALDSGSPRRVFRWLERTRAGALRYPPARPPDDPALAGELMRLRELEAELRDAQLAGKPTAGLWELLTKTQDIIRRRSLRASAAAGEALEVPEASDVLAALARPEGGSALVEFGISDGDLFAVVLQNSRAKLVSLCEASAVTREVDALRAAARRLARPNLTPESAAAAGAMLSAASERLDGLVVRPLALRFDRVVVIPTQALYGLPWALLGSLADAVVTISPSATLWRRGLGRAELGEVGRVVVASGPRLDQAAAEVVAVSAAHVGAVSLLEPTAAELLAAIDGAGIAHIACHGTLRTDNPLFSALEMGDGPLTVYDLERLRSVPRLMVLSACDTGVSSSSAADEVMGLTASLLGMGAGAVVANLGLVPDTPATIALMVDVHRRVAGGVNIAQALADSLPKLDPSDVATIAARCFTVFAA